MLELAELKRILRYDPETGSWIWIVAPFRRPSLLGQEAGHTSWQDGTRRIMIRRKMYRSARLAWFYMTGAWPVDEIDHINRNASDDRWINLREATRSDNMHNTRLHGCNTSGVRGVNWLVAKGKWRAEIDGMHIGLFDTIEEASTARDSVAIRLHGEFASLNNLGA